MDYDVIVAGGGSAGVGAAVAAAREGARTLLIEAAGCLGGAATTRGVLTYCGLYTIGEPMRRAVLGVAEDVLRRLRAWGAVTPPQRHRGVFVAFDPEAAKRALDAVCAEAGVEVLLHATIVAAARAPDGRIAGLHWADHSGTHEARAAAFVDATGEADLAHLAGAATRYGNAGAVNLGTLATRFGGIPRDVALDAGMLTAAITQARARGAGPLSKDRSVLTRLPISGDVACFLAAEDADARDARSLSAAEAHGRAQAWAYLEIVRALPGCGGAYLASTGPGFGTRESRHLVSRGQLAWDDVQAGIVPPDGVALGAWAAEWHDRETYASSFALPPGGGAYAIPLSCLASADAANLFAAGRTADGDRLAGSSLRVMGTAFATGQAAGIAAALVAATGGAEATDVRGRLRAQGALLDPGEMPPAA